MNILGSIAVHTHLFYTSTTNSLWLHGFCMFMCHEEANIVLVRLNLYCWWLEKYWSKNSSVCSLFCERNSIFETCSWNATEFCSFLWYNGPLVLKGILDDNKCENFMESFLSPSSCVTKFEGVSGRLYLL